MTIPLGSPVDVNAVERSNAVAAEPTSRPETGASVSSDPALRVVIVGHVDHGKSTVVGRLLADAGALPANKLESLRSSCERNAKPFEYAFLLDALKDEQAQGITIDAARVFFRTDARRYIIIDAPGHVEFLKNMVTGASHAEAALLVIDAREGVRENSLRHGYLLSMLGISQIVVIVNKMDLVDYSRDVFDTLSGEYARFLERIGVRATRFIPVAAQLGSNIVHRSDRLQWYDGPTVIEMLDQLQSEPRSVDAPLRMPVQGVYKFTERSDERRIVAGTIETGRVCIGDQIIFYPSGKKTRVHSIEAFNRPVPTEAKAGEATGFTMTEQVYVARGEIATRADEPPPEVTTRLRVSLFWLGKRPLIARREYWLKLGTARVQARVETIDRTLDAATLDGSDGAHAVERHQVAECTLSLARPLAFDLVSNLAPTGRFVIVDDHEICGGGIVREALPDRQSWVRDKVLRRNSQWAASRVSEERRIERYSQRPVLLLVTGPAQADRKGLAREFEAQLFDEGRLVYFLGMGNLVYGVDADLARSEVHRPEHLRRLGEVANILLDAGMIVVAAAANLGAEEVAVLRTAVGQDRVSTVWLGGTVGTDLVPDLILPQEHEEDDDRLGRLKTLLQDQGVIFRNRF